MTAAAEAAETAAPNTRRHRLQDLYSAAAAVARKTCPPPASHAQDARDTSRAAVTSASRVTTRKRLAAMSSAPGHDATTCHTAARRAALHAP